MKPLGAAPRRNRFNDAQHALDEARDAFTRAAAALTSGNRLHDRSALATAVLEGAYGMMRLAQGDIDERAMEEAVAHIKQLRKGAA